MRNFLMIMAMLFLMGCGSPQNHKVVESDVVENNEVEALNLPTYKFSKLGLSVQAKWLKGPFDRARNKSKLMVFFRDDNDELKSLNKLGVRLYTWMPAMGHGSAGDGFFEEVSEGIYVNSNIKFNMSGEWQLFIQIYDENDKLESEVSWSEFL